MIDFSEDANAQVVDPKTTLERITELSQQLFTAMGEVVAATESLQQAKDRQRQLEENDLPELMRELGVTDIKLKDGSAVKVVDEVQCSITEANRPRAHAWLVDHGFGGLIKTNVIVAFARDERDAAVTCAEEIRESIGREAEVSESVHVMTLKSFVKEQLTLRASMSEEDRAATDALPEGLFGIRPYAKAKLTPPKAK